MLTSGPLPLKVLLALGALVPPVTCAAASGSAGLEQGEPPARHLVLVTVDGLRPEFYLERSWPAPVLQEMARQGAHARSVQSVFPSLTLPSHATIITGALPARHGIVGNQPFLPGVSPRPWYFEADSVRSPTLYQAVAAAGGITASIGWPSTRGAAIRYNLPEVHATEPGTTFVDAIRAAATPPGFLDSLEARVGPVTVYDAHHAPAPWNALAWDDRVGAMAEWILQFRKPRLLMVHLVSVDEAQHEYGTEAERVRRALAAADRAVGRMAEAAERAGILEETAFLVMGDHGFADVVEVLKPNVWLAERGLLDPAPQGAWRARFDSGSGAAFLRLRDPGDMEAVASVREILGALPPEIRARFQLLERSELDAMGAYPEAALALATALGVRVGDGATGSALEAAEGATHGFLPTYPEMHTGLVAWGAGIRAGGVVETMRLTDVAALAAALLGLDFTAPDGTLPAGLLKQSSSDPAPGGRCPAVGLPPSTSARPAPSDRNRRPSGTLRW